MAKKRIHVAAVLVLAATLSLGACTSQPETPTFGEQVTAQGGVVAKIGTDWTAGESLIMEGQALVADGQDAVENGESLVRKGEKKVSRGRVDISKGERMIAKGERMKREAESAYRARNGSVQPAT